MFVVGCFSLDSSNHVLSTGHSHQYQWGGRASGGRGGWVSPRAICEGGGGSGDTQQHARNAGRHQEEGDAALQKQVTPLFTQPTPAYHVLTRVTT